MIVGNHFTQQYIPEDNSERQNNLIASSEFTNAHLHGTFVLLNSGSISITYNLNTSCLH
jgi:hypothetical protein